MTLYELASLVDFTFDTDFINVKTGEVLSIMDFTVNKMKKRKVAKITPATWNNKAYLKIYFK